ncbi:MULTISPECIES: hypothetical protein [Alysiella]|uniref:Uncharacterized protein n=2 Tax=Alysiella TaxID=194195 RepID=A0A376BVH7_9NEIS|nr:MULTISPECIES: hypothetical protein [Alysiella]QMT30789.1 hypothetical protein H3L97_08565 [Alysiella filiformis]UBQ56229.1 hypothetical protein JF568_00120 [Alysiella filiformis DSM 16848]UOP06401.1 hypothetical protein LVJ80_11550 [Alysiella crassa]SOD64845.1 hypothetical protein SAMN02746062_00063 [Alysiella filiformis DSM 16848]SSY80919.1 Uncharacterised protein [Alysiella crassa]
MRIILFLLLSILWFWWVYGLTLALAGAFKTGVARTPIAQYSRQNQPLKFALTVLVQAIFWVGLVFWWLNGLWNFLIKLFD